MGKMDEKKKRSPRTVARATHFVVYVSKDADEEVCRFLNQLKARGDFSNEVMMLVGQYLKIARLIYDKEIERVPEDFVDRLERVLSRKESLSMKVANSSEVVEEKKGEAIGMSPSQILLQARKNVLGIAN